ncbi:MAG: gluconate 2-dehydrogenase subunit 3 family protein [Deltaproteobacteria bacterium]|nr:gluconate 2-dehydrogenase subunit 3 family protein [Deltaproteobacteria bacterium]
MLRDLLAQGAALASLAAAVAAGVRLQHHRSAAEDPLTAGQWLDLAAVQALILPSEAEVPGAAEIGATQYVRQALADPRLEPDDLESLQGLLLALERGARQTGGPSFAALAAKNQADIIEKLLSDPEAAEQFGVVVVCTLEALLTDPVYGGNRNGAGWRWLGLEPALPQPPQPWFQGAA